MNQPLPIQPLSQAMVNAGVADGYRQGLEQCANNLRKQARDWRAQAQAQLKQAGLSPVATVRARLLQAEVERWATRFEQLADQIMAEHARREGESKQLKKVAETLLSAFDQGQSKLRRWLPWHR